MSYPVMPGQETPSAIRQISANITKCLSLWRSIMVLCQGRPSMSTGIIRDMSLSLEETLRRGEMTVGDVPPLLPDASAAFDLGDPSSRGELRRVILSQQELMGALEDIKEQLTLAFAPQATPTKGPRRTPNPERVLNIDRVWSLVDSVNSQLEKTSEALAGLSKRVTSPLARQESALPGSFPQGPQYGYPQTPEVDRDSKSASMKDAPFSPQPTLRLRSEQPPPQPPRPAQGNPEQSPGHPPHQRQPSSEEKQKPAEKQTERRADKPIETPLERPAERSMPRATPNTTGGPITPKIVPLPPTRNISHRPGNYCIGAIRLQQNASLGIADITRHDSYVGQGINPNSICRHCNLELDTSLPGEILPDGSKKKAIAMQHIMACASLVDPRAMFRCLSCAKKEQDAEFRAGSELWTHMMVAHLKT